MLSGNNIFKHKQMSSNKKEEEEEENMERILVNFINKYIIKIPRLFILLC